MNRMKTLCLASLALGTLLVSASASARIIAQSPAGYFWHWYMADSGNSAAADALENDESCTYPWGGGENVVSAYMEPALENGEESAFWYSAANTYGSDLYADMGEDFAQLALDDACVAAMECETVACEDNDGCDDVSSAIMYWAFPAGRPANDPCGPAW